MHVKWFDQIEDIPLSPEQWNDLVQKNDTNTVFQTYEWFESWWNSIGKKHKLVFLAAYDIDSIVGFVPLMLIDGSFGNKSLHFAGDTNSDYCDFVINGNHIQIITAFLEYLYTSTICWNSIELNNIPSQSISIACLQTVCYEKDYKIGIKQRIKAPALLLYKNRDYALSLINKYSVSRHLRKIKRLGNLEFINLNNKDEIINYLDTFFNQHIERYSLKNMTSQFANVKNRNLYTELVNNFDNTDWLLFSILLLNGKPIAFHFGFNYNKKIIWYKPSFSPEYKRFSPGTLLLKYLVEYAIETNCHELDFTIGDEAFKGRFSNYVKFNNSFIIYRSGIRCVIHIIIKNASRIFSRLRT